MDDLISRQEAINAMCWACGLLDCYKYDCDKDEQVIICPEHYALSTLPSAQPEIIECKDCKYRGEKPIADGRYWCELHDTFMYYCSDAERRTDD